MLLLNRNGTNEKCVGYIRENDGFCSGVRRSFYRARPFRLIECLEKIPEPIVVFGHGNDTLET